MMVNKNKNILLIAIFHVILSNLISNPMLKFLATLGSMYWSTHDIRRSLSYTIISTILSYIMSQYTHKEGIEFDAPDPLDSPLDVQDQNDDPDSSIDLTGGTGALSEVRVLADTPQSVMFSEEDDPDKPDNIELNPIIPVIDIETTKEWEREKQSRQALEILKTEPQLGTKPPQETPALEPEAFTSLFYY